MQLPFEIKKCNSGVDKMQVWHSSTYRTLFSVIPKDTWALNYKVCEVIINYQECPTGFVGRYITDVTVSAKTNWFSRIREMMCLFVLSNLLPLHRKPYLPWKTDSQKYSSLCSINFTITSLSKTHVKYLDQASGMFWLLGENQITLIILLVLVYKVRVLLTSRKFTYWHK